MDRSLGEAGVLSQPEAISPPAGNGAPTPVVRPRQSVRPTGRPPLLTRPALTLVAPAYNEEENIRPLFERVLDAFEDGVDWELVLVDDGSVDGTRAEILRLARNDPRVRCVALARNSGQTSAMAAGARAARAPLTAFLDADLQNDPVDLPAMLAALGEHDAVVGYRVKREDTFVRRASSKIANAVRNALTGDEIRDTGCSLKLFRTEALLSIPLFEGMHRFLPTLLRYHGYSVIEHPVSHHPRRFGQSKYGISNRLVRSLRDLFAVRWMRTRILRAHARELDPGASTEEERA